MFPKHGKVDCRLCFETGEGPVRKPHPEWKMVNDPGAWGGGEAPEYLVLGFSKGATQTNIYQTGRFEEVAFAKMRPRLTTLLQTMGLLESHERADDKIADPNSNISFGSLIRCSVTRLDKAKSAKAGKEVYSCTGPLINKSFREIPTVIATCTQRFLTQIPASVKAVLLLGNDNQYVKNCTQLLRQLFPADFRQINAMAVYADGRLWVCITHPSGTNGYFTEWLTTDQGQGAKRILAQAALHDT